MSKRYARTGTISALAGSSPIDGGTLKAAATAGFVSGSLCGGGTIRSGGRPRCDQSGTQEGNPLIVCPPEL